MVIQLNGANIVILAQEHNPTIASSHWLFSKGIMPEQAVNFMHIPSLSHYESQNFTLEVDHGRWQLRTNNTNPDIVERLPFIAITYIRTLPETDYRAIGLNFEWRVKRNGNKNLAVITKSIFVNPEGTLAMLAKRDDCVITGIIQINHDGFRVQVTVTPGTESDQELRFRFNYHQDIIITDSNERVKKLEESINKFTNMLQYSEKLVREIVGGE